MFVDSLFRQLGRGGPVGAPPDAVIWKTKNSPTFQLVATPWWVGEKSLWNEKLPSLMTNDELPSKSMCYKRFAKRARPPVGAEI
jgi:hypothetical protein